MSKGQIRKIIGQMNRSIGLGERTEETHNIFSAIEIDQKFITSKTIAIYVSLPDEVATQNLIKRWNEMGKRIAIPRVKGEEMEFVEYKSDKLSKGAYSIMEPTNDDIVEPSEIELMIVPGVAFCSDGRRLGRGKGYYDRYLSHSDFNAYTIGIGFAHQLLDELPTEDHDIKLSRVICPAKRTDKPSLPELIIKIIDAAGEAAVGLGCGVEWLISKGYTWVLSRLSIEIFEQPLSKDDIIIETWIEECKRIATTRDFIISNRAGERIGIATSQWCMIDMNARRPIDLTTPEFDYQRHVDPHGIEIGRPRKIAQLDGESITTSNYTVTELDIDINNHLNTMRYIEMMMSMIKPHRRDGYAHLRLDLHFMNESLLGDRLTINHIVQPTESGTELHFEIIRPDTMPSARAIFNYKD